MLELITRFSTDAHFKVKKEDNSQLWALLHYSCEAACFMCE